VTLLCCLLACLECCYFFTLPTDRSLHRSSSTDSSRRTSIIVIVSASVRRGADAERYGLQEDYYYY
jgi:hypothetical protein